MTDADVNLCALRSARRPRRDATFRRDAARVRFFSSRAKSFC